MTQSTQNSAPSLLDSTPIHDKHSMLSALDGEEQQQSKLKHPGLTNFLRFAVGGVIVLAFAVTVIINSWMAPQPKIILDPPLKAVTTTESRLTSETKTQKTGTSPAENSAPLTAETLPVSPLTTNAKISEAPSMPAAIIITELESPIPQKSDSTRIATGNNAHERLNAALSGSPVPDTDTAADRAADKSADPITTHKGSALAASKRVAGKSGDDRDVKVLSALVASSEKTDHKKPDQSDSDIQVISALVASVKPAASKPKSSGQQSTYPTKSLVKNTENDNKDQSNNLNVAEHSADESIRGQIEQCKALGIVDDMLCRWRACSGHWSNDPICQGVSQ